MKDPSDFDSAVLVRMLTVTGGNQFDPTLIATLSNLWGIVMSVTQTEADFGGQLLDQFRCDLTAAYIGHGQFSRQWNPDPTDGDCQMEFPSVPPSVVSDLDQPASVAGAGSRVGARSNRSARQGPRQCLKSSLPSPASEKLSILMEQSPKFFNDRIILLER